MHKIWLEHVCTVYDKSYETNSGILEVGGVGNPREFMTQFRKRVGETLDVTSTIVQEVKTHGLGCWIRDF